jgi:uncharacterized protein (DUF1499 family)
MFMPGSKDGRLQNCPKRPNCVSSEARDSAGWIAPLAFSLNAQAVWKALYETVEALPRSRVVDRTEDYLHVELRSRIFGFVDDLEFQLREQEGIIGMRSAARTGYYDLGVNRRRLERLRAALRGRGVID